LQDLQRLAELMRASDAQRATALAGAGYGPNSYSSEERELSAKLRGLYGEEISEWLEYADRLNNAQTYDQLMKDTAEMSKSHPALASLASVPMSLMGGVGVMDLAVQMLQKSVGNRTAPVDYKTPGMIPSSVASGIRETVSGQIEAGTDGKFGLGLSIVYRVVTTYNYKVEAENTDNGVLFRIYRVKHNERKYMPKKSAEKKKEVQ